MGWRWRSGWRFGPLFLWSLVGVFRLGVSRLTAIHVGLMIQAFAATVAALLVLRYLRAHGAAWAGACAAGLLSLNLFFVLPTLTGFEMALALAAMLLAVVAWQREAHPFLIGILCGLSVLARVDTLVMAAVFAVDLAARRRVADLVRLAAGLAVVAGPVAVWNVMAFGHPLTECLGSSPLPWRCLTSRSSIPRKLPRSSATSHALAPAFIQRVVPAGQRIGSFDAGALGDFSPRPVINLDGLANHDIVELRRRCAEPYDECLREYFRSRGIGVLAGGTGFGWTGHFSDWTSWDRLYESAPLIDGSRLVILKIPDLPPPPPLAR